MTDKAKATRKKIGHKGKACRRSQPVYYGEVKRHCNILLTPTALEKLEQLAIDQEISRSEVIERWLRSLT